MILTIPEHTKPVDLTLASGAIVDLRPPRGGADVVARSGRVWITQTGDPNDHVLNPGESFHVKGKRLVVVQALQASCVGFV